MRKFWIVVADDDHDDFLTLREAFDRHSLEHNLDHALNGNLLFEMLQECRSSEAALPDLIVLDLNMPKIDGFEVLRNLKTTEAFSQIPVLMYSTSADAEHIRKCFLLGANAFVTKGYTFATVLSVADGIEKFLTGRQDLPGTRPPSYLDRGTKA
jgi:CheY-like chemotaxis protein